MDVCTHSRSVLLVILLMVVYGCASNIPAEIRHEPVDNPSVTAVSQDSDRFAGRNVRWGGAIVSVENKADSTWIEIVATRLNRYGRPVSPDEDTEGRFLARFDGFLDPEVYDEERKITVYGNVESRLVRKIDDYPYTYPLIRATSHYLWPVQYYSPYRNYAYDPFYPYPYWYDPYYGFPYRHHYRFRHYYGFHFGHFY